MDGKWNDQNPRLRTDERRGATPPTSDSSEPSGKFRASKVGNRNNVYGTLCLLVLSFIVAACLVTYLLRLQSASPSETGFWELLARPAQAVFSNSSSTQTGSSQPSVRIMAPLTELKTSVVKPGSGSAVAKGQRVTVHATGSVLNADGTTKKFWSTKDPGQQPFTWQAGLGQVIAGWDQGVLGMNLGETRMIYIPAKMGYGQNGFSAWGIPPNADLQFEIECLKIQ